MAGYTTFGRVRGCCGHRHRNREAAERCVAADRAGRGKARGCSDRAVFYISADGYLLTDDGAPVWPRRGRSGGAVRFGD